ncbi:hypothetical protein [Fulvivirga sp.]|uniref:hypothetical protein n=1 Tax=Fulvivirga sp. TaxID=1931237 RepID=UPI0032EEEFB0
MELYNYAFYTSISTAGIATLFGIKLIKTQTINLLVILVAVSFLADVINAINAYFYMELKTDLGIRHVGDTYRIIELFILIQFFNAFGFNKWAKKIILVFGILVTLYFFVIQTKFYQTSADSSILRTSSALLTMAMSIFFFRNLLIKMEIPDIEKWPPFYFISSQFIYFCGVVIAFIIYEPMFVLSYSAGRTLWAFHNTWLIVRNILLIMGFYYTYKTNYKWEKISLI